MAKLYKTDDCVFYDAFGGKIGTVEEVEYYGDSFDRSTACCYAADAATVAKGINSHAEGTLTATTCGWEPVVLNTLTGANDTSSAIGALKVNGQTYSIKADVSEVENRVDSLTAQLNELRAQIDSLTPRQVAKNKLHSQLKTLQYKREVE